MNNVHPVFDGLLESLAPKERPKERPQETGLPNPEGWEKMSPGEQIAYLSGESDGFCRGLQEGYKEGVKAMKLQHRKKMAELEKYLNDMNSILGVAFREILDEDMPL